MPQSLLLVCWAAGGKGARGRAAFPQRDGESGRLTNWIIGLGSERLARNPYFSAPLIDSRIANHTVRTDGLPEGMYYWLVQRIDNTGHESLEDNPGQFRIVAPAQTEAELGLQLESISQVGRAVRVQGRTEPGSTLTINAETVQLSESGQFSYATPPLLPGNFTLTIPSQDRSGRAVTRQQSFSVK